MDASSGILCYSVGLSPGAITVLSDPALWASLLSLYQQKESGHVTLSSDMYKVVILNDGEITFLPVEPLSYLDSRSLIKSRSSSYKKLDNG